MYQIQAVGYAPHEAAYADGGLPFGIGTCADAYHDGENQQGTDKAESSVKVGQGIAPDILRAYYRNDDDGAYPERTTRLDNHAQAAEQQACKE